MALTEPLFGGSNRSPIVGSVLKDKAPVVTPAKSRLPKPLTQPKNRSELLAFVLEDMREQARQPNPQSWAETGLRALNQGLRGYFAGKAIRDRDIDEQKQRDMIADLLEDPKLKALAQAGVLGNDDWAKAILEQSMKGTKESEFTLSPGQQRFREGKVIAEVPAKPDKPTDRERRVEMLMETGVPEPIAQGIAAGRYYVSRHPVSQEAQVVDMATGRIVFPEPGGGAGQAGDGAAVPVEPGAAADGAAPGVGEAPPAFVPQNVDPTKATGLSGAITGVVNVVSDLFGQGLPFPEHDEAAEALNTMQVYTMSALQAEVPGRPSQFLLERIQKLTVDPRSILRADERALNRLRQTRDLLKTEIDRIDNDVISRPREFRPNEITNARLNKSQLQQLHRAYDTMLTTAKRRRGEGRPPLEQFDRRR